MRTLAAAAVLLTLAAGGASGGTPRLLAIDRTAQRLAWFDPGTLAAKGRAAELGFHLCSWSFSPARAWLAVAGCNSNELRIVDLRRMRSAGDMQVGILGRIDGLNWARPDRLLVVSHGDADWVAIVDPGARTVVRRVPLPQHVQEVRKLDGAVALLLAPQNGFAPAQVAVVDADGTLRRVVLERITVGTKVSRGGGADSEVRERRAGFAVDPATRRAFVVDADLSVAEVDLSTLAVRYHDPPRTLAKASDGPERRAEWLGGGLLAVGGADYAAGHDAQGRETMTTTPLGLRIVDTRAWTARVVDAAAAAFDLAGGLLLVQRDAPHVVAAYGANGRERWSVSLGDREWLDVEGAYAYVCDNLELRRVVDARTGRTLRTPSGRNCVTLLNGSSATY